MFSAAGKRLVFSRNPRVFDFFPPAQQASFGVFLGLGRSEIAFSRELGHFSGANFCRSADAVRAGNGWVSAIVFEISGQGLAPKRKDAEGCGGGGFLGAFFRKFHVFFALTGWSGGATWVGRHVFRHGSGFRVRERREISD